MNDPFTTSDQNPVKPCRKCGEADRYASGRCKKCHKACAKSSYQKHKNRRLSANKAWIAENKQRHKELLKNWRKNNRDAHRSMIKQWELKNPNKVKEKSIRSRNARRARIANTNGRLSKNIVSSLMMAQNGQCVYCRSKFGKYHLDHIIPLALGGANIDSNVQLLCPSCNMSKGAKDPIEFAQLKGLLL